MHDGILCHNKRQNKYMQHDSIYIKFKQGQTYQRCNLSDKTINVRITFLSSLRRQQLLMGRCRGGRLVGCWQSLSFPGWQLQGPLFKNISFLSMCLYNMCGYISHWGAGTSL